MREFSQLAEQAHIFYPDPQEQQLRQEGMRQFVDNYLQDLEEGVVDPGLRPYQRLGFPLILRTIRDDLSEPVDPNAPDILDQLSHAQIAEAAMGYGKSFLLAQLAVATGVGRMPYEGATTPLRALFLSYTKRGVEAIAQACREFTATTSMLRYEPGLRHSLEGYDVTVLSYAALCSMVRKRLAGRSTPFDGQHFDLIGTDENHHRWGARFSHAVNVVARGRVEVGMTGTRRITKENKDIHVSFRCSLRQMIQGGHGPTTQVLAFPTGKSVTSGIRTPRDPFVDMEKLYSWEELKPLALDVERNYQAVELLKEMAARGHSVLGSMIPGAECTHAKIIHGLVNEERIVDPRTGRERKLNFEPIDSYMPEEEIQELLARSKHPYPVSGLDGLLSTSLLTESFDNTNLSAVVAACPLPFIPLAQLAGRLNRGGKDKIAVFAQMVDRAEATRRPAFIGDVYEEGGFFNGIVIGQEEQTKAYNLLSGWRPGAPHTVHGQTGGGQELPAALIVASSLSEALRRRADALDTYLDESRHLPLHNEIVKENHAILSKPPDNSVKVTALYRLPNVQAANLNEKGFYALLDSNGFTYSLVHDDRGIANYAHNKEKVIAFLENYNFAELHAPERFTRRELARHLSTSLVLLDNAIVKLAAEGKNMTPEPRRRRLQETDTYNAHQKALLEQAFQERKAMEVPQAEGHPYESLGTLARNLGAHRQAIRAFVIYALKSTLLRFIDPELQVMTTYVNPEDAVAVRTHFGYPEVPPAATLLETIGHEFDLSATEVLQAFETAERREFVQQGRRIVRKGGGSAGIGGRKYGEDFELTYPFFCEDSQTIELVRELLRGAQKVRTAATPQPSAAPASSLPRIPRRRAESVARPAAVRLLPPGITLTFEMPSGYVDALDALREQGVHCDPRLMDQLIKRTKGLTTPCKNEFNRWFLNKESIDVLSSAIQNIPVATHNVITLEELVVYCKQQGFKDIELQDVVNLYRLTIEGQKPLPRRNRMGILRTKTTSGHPTVLKAHFEKVYMDEVIERLSLLRRTMRLPVLRKARCLESQFQLIW